MVFTMLSLIIPMILMFLFYLASKGFLWENKVCSVFECGFTSYFFSRFSFSNHYFIMGLIFLFLDLELCLLFPFFKMIPSNLSPLTMGWIFAFILLLGLMMEWKEKALEWTYWAMNFVLHSNS